jgi:tetratricopeptide (TPR) repeat protein
MKHRLLALTAMVLWSGAAQADWHEARSKHFIVYSDDDADDVKAFATRLEKFDKALKLLREVPEDNRTTSARVTVYVVDSVEAVRQIYPGRNKNVAGFYDSRSSGSVAFVPRRSGSGASFEASAQRILLHEYGHHFMFTYWPGGIYPKWFIEGFAEFNSTAEFLGDGSIQFGAPPLDRGSGVLLAKQIPLSKMLRPDPGKLDPMQANALYSRGWLLTHFVTMDPERLKQFGSYISALNAGKSVEEAAKVFGGLNALELKLNSYARRPGFQTLRIDASRLDIGDVKVRKLGRGEAAIMPAQIRSNAGVDEKTAPQVLALARRLAAPYPDDPAVQNELAEAEYDAKNYAQAMAAAERALAADPKSVHAALYKGMALQAIAEKAKSTDAGQWKEIRRWYVAANKIDPEDPQPLILYYRSFKPAKQEPTESAKAGLLYAYALAPYDFGLRAQAGRVFLQQGKVVEARRALAPVAYSDEVGPLAERMREVLGVLDAQGAAPALALLEKQAADAEKAAATAPKT